MTQEIGLSQVCDEIGTAFSKDDYKRVEALLWPALDQFSDNPQLWFYAGNLFFGEDLMEIPVGAPAPAKLD